MRVHYANIRFVRISLVLPQKIKIKPAGQKDYIYRVCCRNNVLVVGGLGHSPDETTGGGAEG